MVGTPFSIRRRRRRVCALVGVLGVSFTFVGAHAGPAGSDPIPRYVALGDSYSSGEGTFAYDAATDIAKQNECHRSSTHAYPALVRDALTYEFTFACSGAETEHLLKKKGGSGGWKEGAQVDAITQFEEAADPAVALVTLTIGGNDVKFAKILKKCITSDSIFWKNTDDACKNAGAAWVKDGLTRLTKKFSLILDRIHTKAPNAVVRVLHYPSFVPLAIAGNCTVGTLLHPNKRIGLISFWVTPAAVTNFNTWLNQLNAELTARVDAWSAQNPGVDVGVVPTAQAFADHTLCTADPTDVNGLLFDEKRDPRVASFHPTQPGHVKIADAVLATLVPL